LTTLTQSKRKKNLETCLLLSIRDLGLKFKGLDKAKKLQRLIKEPPGFAGQFFRLVNHKYFEGAITFFIFLNTFVMALKHYQMSQ
jgi:hypothetical protein